MEQCKPIFIEKTFMTTQLKDLIKKAYSAFNERGYGH
jgi:hypothetical protein